jgi:hypothetical protein
MRYILNKKQPLTTQDTIVTKSAENEEFITGQNEREETTQDTTVTKSAACASYEINYFYRQYSDSDSDINISSSAELLAPKGTVYLSLPFFLQGQRQVRG